VRITLVSHDFISGEGQGEVTRRIAASMARRGHSVHVVGHRIEPGLSQQRGVTAHFVDVPRTRPAILKEVWFMLRSAAVIRREGLQGTVIHGQGDVTLVRHHVNTIHFAHGSFRRVTRQLGMRLGLHHALYHAIHARLEGVAFRRCAGSLVAVSEKVRRELGAAGYGAGRVRIIRHGVDVEPPPPRRAARDRILSEFGLPKTATIFLFAGELTRGRKGLGTLLRALALLPAASDARLIVAGHAQGSPLVGEADRLGVRDRVVFCGFRRDLPALMAGADAFVLPTRYDTFGLVVLEALAVGTPVIVSSPEYCGAAELVTEASGVLLGDPTDPAELRDALRRLAEDPALRRRMGEAGEAVARTFTWERAYQQYEELYAELDGSPMAAARPVGADG
jgi:glycosyltransferase involved in cell wall biosynthesis